jgi:hypothetical protein
MKNKVQWRRVKEGGLELFVFEPDDKGVGMWKLYTNSKCYAPDIKLKGASRGLETLRKCLKNGYILLDVEGNEVKI